MLQILFKSASFVFIILLAYVLKKAELFGSQDYKVVTKIALNVTLPAAIITSFASYQVELSLVICSVLGFGMNWLVLGIAYILTKKKDRASRALWLNCSPGYNIGTFALPFVQSFLSPASVVACCLFDAGSATMCAGGTYALSCGWLGEKGGFSLKQIGKRLLSSVPFVFYITMLIVTLLGISVPQQLISFIEPLAKANPFIAMFMIGLMFEIKIEKSRIWEIIKILIIRVGIAILAVLGFYFLLPLGQEFRLALAIAVFAPVSVASTAFSEIAGADPADAGCLNSLSIPVSIVGIVAILAIFGAL